MGNFQTLARLEIAATGGAMQAWIPLRRLRCP
jgi:hypothetical protein